LERYKTNSTLHNGVTRHKFFQEILRLSSKRTQTYRSMDVN